MARAVWKGPFVEESLIKKVEKQKIEPNKTKLFTCGPELMMKNVIEMSIDSGVDCYAAMERYLPCSVAVCGLCMVGDRLTCRDGPVMEGDWLLQQDDFASHNSH